MSVDKPNQFSNYTEFDRTPAIFKTVRDFFPKLKILSFGCSSGEEVRCLKSIYFRDAIVHGIDINRQLIEENISKNRDKEVSYYHDFDKLSDDYDIIFCMSVLCRWPENQFTYKFCDFEETLEKLDLKLKVGGYIVVYNGQFPFEETRVARRYIPQATSNLTSGFVHMFSKDSFARVVGNFPVVFRKIERKTTHKYGVLWASTSNLGDDIQTIAGMNFFRKKGLEVHYFQNREGKFNEEDEFSLLMNGWWMHNLDNFPPPENITPILISFHVANEILVEKNKHYFKKYEPVGCRDTHTVAIFRKYGIEAYFSGCLTLYFNPNWNKGTKRYIVDVNTCPYIPKVNFERDNYQDYESISHDIHDKELFPNLDTRLDIGSKLLAAYASAELVITSRLHVALPCRAFRTPVKFLHSNLRDNRFSGLESILAGAGNIDFAKSTIPDELILKIVNGFDRVNL